MLETAHEDPYLNLTKELEAIAGKNNLEQIVIDIGVETDRVCTTDPTKWAQLDDVLSIDNGFPFLRCVEVTIAFWAQWNNHEEYLQKMWDIGRNAFPWLVAAKQIEFKFDVKVRFIV